MKVHAIKIRTSSYKEEAKRPQTVVYENDNRTYVRAVRKRGGTITVPIATVVRSRAFRRYILDVSIRFFFKLIN